MKQTVKKQEARLENWFSLQHMLIGEVYGHPKFRDGTVIGTSKVLELDKEGKRAETLNTHYELGTHYEPGAPLKEEETE